MACVVGATPVWGQDAMFVGEQGGAQLALVLTTRARGGEVRFEQYMAAREGGAIRFGLLIRGEGRISPDGAVGLTGLDMVTREAEARAQVRVTCDGSSVRVRPSEGEEVRLEGSRRVVPMFLVYSLVERLEPRRGSTLEFSMFLPTVEVEHGHVVRYAGEGVFEGRRYQRFEHVHGDEVQAEYFVDRQGRLCAAVHVAGPTFRRATGEEVEAILGDRERFVEDMEGS